MTDPVDHKTWRTFDLDETKRFAWDICREVAEKGSEYSIFA
jgi:hypothetical protein